MGRHSTLKRLPGELQDLVHRLIRDGKTIDEILAHLLELDAEVSRSAVGRYVKSKRELMERYTASQEVAGAIVEQIGENPRGDVGALLAAMLKTIGVQMLDNQIVGGEEVKPLDPAGFHFLAKALDHLERSAAFNLKRRLEIEKLVLARQAKAAEKVARERGLSDADWAALRAEFLGVRDGK